MARLLLLLCVVAGAATCTVVIENPDITGRYLYITSEAFPNGDEMRINACRLQMRLIAEGGGVVTSEQEAVPDIIFPVFQDLDDNGKLVIVENQVYGDRNLHLLITCTAEGSADLVVAVWAGVLQLEGVDYQSGREAYETRIVLQPRDSNCDKDGDGHEDCAVESCCSRQPVVLSDCQDDIAEAHTFASLPSCIKCADSPPEAPLDYNCDGVPDPCIDEDKDGHEDCRDPVDVPELQCTEENAEKACDDGDLCTTDKCKSDNTCTNNQVQCTDGSLCSEHGNDGCPNP